MADKNKDKEYFQVILDKNKPHDKHYIDIIDRLINQEGKKKKDILFLALDKLIEEDSLKGAVKEANKEVVEEIKDLKLMIKAIASGNIAVTTDIIEDKETIETIGVDISEINEDDLKF